MILLWVTGSMKLLSLGSARFKRLCFSSLCCINVMQEPKGHVPIDDTTHTHLMKLDSGLAIIKI